MMPDKELFNFDINANVKITGADDAAKTLAELQEKINEAKTLVSELTSLTEKLEIKIEM